MNVQDLIQDFLLQDWRNEASTNTLDFVRTFGFTLDNSTFRWLDRDSLHLWLHRLEIFRAAGNSAASANASYKVINLALSLLPDFWSSRLSVNLGVVWVLKLLQDDAISFLGYFVGHGKCTRETLGRRRANKLCSKRSNDNASLHTHGIWHANYKLVSLHGSNHCQGNTGISGCRFNKGVARFDATGLLGFFNHALGHTIFHRITRLKTLHLAHDICISSFRDLLQFEQRCITNQLGNVVGNQRVWWWINLLASIHSLN